ncbi:plasmid mobilization protein [Sphingobacterium daejeonense]|uniref:plasmid mobilization protein n=1 Tax=Sphingobacterium daejeonense TaxID=371142 RepID=UPI0035CD1301
MKNMSNDKERDGQTRRRGRPKKAITRCVSLVVRMTPTERLAIAGKARNAGLRLSDWFRQSAKTSVIRPRLSREESGHLRTLSGMANNLNQLTRLAHRERLVTIMADLRRLLSETERLMERIGRDDS